MARKYIRIGSITNAMGWDDGDFDSAIETDQPIKAGTPGAANDVLRVEDTVNGSIVDGDRLQIDYVPINYTRDPSIPQATLNTDLSAHLAGISNQLGNKIRVTSNYNVTVYNRVIFCNTDAGDVNINLPAGTNGERHLVVNTGTSGNTAYLIPNGAEKLFGVNASEYMIDGEQLDVTYNSIDGWF